MLLGFGGALTFKNARRAVEAVAALSLENIVLETDCPYMAPGTVPGKRMPFRHDPLHSPESGGHQAGAFGGSAAYNRTERPRAAGRINGPAHRLPLKSRKLPPYHLENGIRRELIFTMPAAGHSSFEDPRLFPFMAQKTHAEHSERTAQSICMAVQTPNKPMPSHAPST